ncbi:LysR family transcriptional regulator [Hydrogenophaga sp. YM1]|uniref:LysR family transcriptional regulator n=1 Tax=Hydrogenophaga TaxID=47420 RepID=UPI00086F3A46|nr:MULTISPECIES: LysR family transcriptional regulator [unclassified Hydrogenophaga]MBN9371912.1 LysR family transcriptional regulator [Hydrogenophaga sp.]ODT32712.1 MAG: LysR family transcriptional regulator [Hydrogenophaga sp. SCN 70-13]OJV44698.1 MAG: LysR family transcriptional regulator [Hydrogenophaga sp. 70-12]QRR34952.1 LysR family transcriptional regulator [Hydrogenophaga sp. YM1]
MAFTSDNLRTFLAVLDTGSFSAAARQLGRVPSAVSMAIAQLEAELDLVLFDRRAREPRPTDVARALEPQARQIASQLRRLGAHAQALHQGLERQLTIAIAPELLSAPWSRSLAVLAEEFPALLVEVLSAPQADALRMLHAGEAQLALVFERPGSDEREGFQELGTELFVAVIAADHPEALARQGALQLNDLIEIRQIAVASRDPRGRDPRMLLSRHLWRTDSHLATLSLVQAGLGWAYLPRRLIEPLVAAGGLTEIRFGNISNQLRLWVDVVWNAERPLGLGAQRFIELMRQATREAGEGPGLG